MAPHEIDDSNFFYRYSYMTPTRIYKRNETNELTGPIFIPPLLCFTSHIKMIKDARTEIGTANLPSLYSCINPQDNVVLLIFKCLCRIKKFISRAELKAS